MDIWIQKELLVLARDIISAVDWVSTEIKQLKYELRNFSSIPTQNAKMEKWQWSKEFNKTSWWCCWGQECKERDVTSVKSGDMKIDASEGSAKQV